MRTTKRLVSFLLVAVMLCSIVPYVETEVEAANFITNAANISGSSLTDWPILAEALDEIFAGDIDVFYDTARQNEVQFPLGTSLDNNHKYTIYSEIMKQPLYGWQCYIYANAVYNKLFGVWVHDGASVLYSENVIAPGTRTLSYDMFESAGVKIGAYIRTTPWSTGGYYGEDGHSMIVLSYNQTDITYLEGNGDGHGLVQIVTRTWGEFNSAQLTGRGRYISRVIQPTTEYYEQLYAGNKVIDKTYPSYCKIDAIGDTNIMSLPCSKKTDETSESLRKVQKGERFTAISLVMNIAGNYWYKVKTDDGIVGYIPSAQVKFVASCIDDVTISNEVVPSRIVQGNSFSLGGVVATKYNNLSAVCAYVATGTAPALIVQTGGREEINKKSYSLAGSLVDKNCKFGILGVGQYAYVIEADLTGYYAADEKTYATYKQTVFVYSTTFTVEPKAAQGCSHSYSSAVTTEPTCTNAGIVTYTCTKCSATYTEQISATGHEYVHNVCVNCGDVEILGNLAWGATYETSPLYQASANTDWEWDDYADPLYPDEYGSSLTDGAIYPTRDIWFYQDEVWCGFNAKSPDYQENGYSWIKVDLGDVYDLTRYTLWVATVGEGSDAGIYAPEFVEFSVSTDGVYFDVLGTVDPVDTSDQILVPVTLEAYSSARYVMIKFNARHYWTFISEVEVFNTSCSHDYSYWLYEAESCDIERAALVCSDCGLILEDYRYGYGEHDYVLVESQVSCVEEGWRLYACTQCGESYYQTIPASWHDFSNWYFEEDPYSYESGRWVRECWICGEKRSFDIEISYTDGDYFAKADNAYGYMFRIEDINGLITGEDATICTSWEAFASCNAKWAVTLYAQRQGDGTYLVLRDAITSMGTIDDIDIELGGDYVAIVIHSAYGGPNDIGLNWMDAIAAKAVKAGDILEFVSIDLETGDCFGGEVLVCRPDGVCQDHNWYLEEYVESTCEDEGYGRYCCTYCDAEYYETYPATGHNIASEAQEPTCTDYGYYREYCTDCGYEFSYEEYEPEWHNYELIEEADATCTEDGYEWLCCVDCGDEYYEVYPAYGHEYDGELTKAATCTENGEYTYTCDSCGDYYVEYIRATGHVMMTEREEPTCEFAGYVTEFCCECEYVASYTELEKTEHQLESLDKEAPTCTEDGYITRACVNCSYEEFMVRPATGHDYQNNVCTSCGDILVVEYGVELHVSNVQASAGETVTVDVVLDKNVGFTYLNLGIEYDSSVLELVSVSNGTIVNSLTQGRSYIWAQADNTTATGVLATLTFAVKEDASAGDYAVAVNCLECCNENEQDVAVLTQPGTVTVVDFIYGDCNGDRKIDGKDVTRLLRYLANYNPITGECGIEASRGADCTGDGSINGKDVTRLLRYLANYDPVTGESSVELG